MCGHGDQKYDAKTHGILQGYLEVDAGLPHDLAQGLFAKPGRYPVVMRFATDLEETFWMIACRRLGALAIKVIGVEGERLEGSKRDVTQDFVLNNGPALGAPNPEKFLARLRLFVARTTNRAQRLKKILSSSDASGAKGNRSNYRTSEVRRWQPLADTLKPISSVIRFIVRRPCVLVISSRKFQSRPSLLN